MSLVGFSAKNHHQQVDARGALDDIDDRATPPEVFDPLNSIFGFTLDVAASEKNAKCKTFFNKDTDGLKQPWGGAIVWCNPPFSNIPGFMEKALHEVIFGGCRRVIMLLPANRCEQPWWQKLVEPFRDYAGSIIKSEFVSGRTRFIFPEGQEPSENRPPFGCVILKIEIPKAPSALSLAAADTQGELFA